MLYNVCYPIEFTLQSDGQDYKDYLISIGSDNIFSGRIYFRSDSETIDISEVCREYMSVRYEDITYFQTGIQTLPTYEKTNSVITFTVSSGSTSINYNVIYNYNTDYILESPDSGILNNPLCFEVDERQLLFLSGHGAIPYSYSVSGGSSGNAIGTGNSIQLYQVNLNNLSLTDGQIITMTSTGVSYQYKVINSCSNRFCIYYVNKAGGLDFMLCSGRDTENWNPARIDAKLFDDRKNRLYFQQTRIYQEIDKQYELNTGLLNYGYGLDIDELINSPKCFIHDLDNSTITSCLITDTSYRIKQLPYDTLIQYTFNVKESQKQIRK